MYLISTSALMFFLGQFQIPYTNATIDFPYSKFAVTGTLLTTCNAMTSNTITSAAAVPYVCPYPSLDPLQADSYGRKTSQLELTSNERIQGRKDELS